MPSVFSQAVYILPLILAGVFISGCTKQVLPPSIQQNALIAIDNGQPQKCPQIIDKLTELIMQHPKDWQSSWHTYPAGDTHLSFFNDGEYQSSIDIGTNFISNRNGILVLAPDEIQALKDFIAYYQ